MTKIITLLTVLIAAAVQAANVPLASVPTSNVVSFLIAVSSDGSNIVKIPYISSSSFDMYYTNHAEATSFSGTNKVLFFNGETLELLTIQQIADLVIPLSLNVSNITQIPSATNTHDILVFPGDGSTNIYRLSLSNLNLFVRMSPKGGNNYFFDMTNAVSLNEGAIGFSYSGDKNPYLWWADGAGVGTNVWGKTINYAGGIANIGDQWHMPPKSLGNKNMNIYFNGGPQFATRFNATNLAPGNVVDSGLYVHNVNPWSSGGFIGLPRYGTNAVGTVVGTNIDGVPIYLQDSFGQVIITIPDAYQIGETNQAPSYCHIFDGTYPVFFSWNMAFPGDGIATAQRSIMAFDTRWQTNNGLPFAVRIPKQVANAWVFTNANWLDTAFFDTISGNVSFLNGTTSMRSVLVTNIAQNAFTIGGAYDELAMANFNGSVSFNAPPELGYDKAWTFDGASAHRLGFVLKTGNYTKLAHGSGSPLTISRSSQTDVLTNVSGQTFTDELVVSATGAVTVSNTVTAPAFIIATNGGPAGITNGLSAFWNSNGVATYLRCGPVGYATNKDVLISEH